MQREWDILRRAEACSACSAAFQPLQEVFSLLSVKAATLGRADFCMLCWPAAPREEGKDLFWRSRVPEAKAAPKEMFDAAELFGILKRLLEENDPTRARLCYLLALYCARKRLIRLKGIDRTGGTERLVFVTPRSRETYLVPSVELSPEDIASARDELGRLASQNAPAA